MGPADLLHITVGNEPDLSGEFQVSAEGSIVYPLLGAVEVAGKTTPGIAEAIRTRLAADYLVSPQVAVYVREYRSKKVAVLGDVPNPGFYVLKADTSLLSLLAEAGVSLSGEDMTLMLRQGKPAAAARRDGREDNAPEILSLEKLLNPWQGQTDVELKHGDQIFVKAGGGGKVIVSGRVKSPGVISHSDGMTLLEAVNKAGGLSDYASAKAIRVVRETPNGSDVTEVNLHAVMGGDRSQDMVLKEGDVVIVPRRWF